MWKILLSSVSFFAICASAFAVNECVYKGYQSMSGWMIIEYSVTTSHAANSLDWTYTLNAREGLHATEHEVGKFYAVGVCAFSMGTDSPATNIAIGYRNPNGDDSYNAKRCWCRMVSPFRSKWIFVYEHDDVTTCQSSCSCNTTWGSALWNAYFNNIIPD